MIIVNLVILFIIRFQTGCFEATIFIVVTLDKLDATKQYSSAYAIELQQKAQACKWSNGVLLALFKLY